MRVVPKLCHKLAKRNFSKPLVEKYLFFVFKVNTFVALPNEMKAKNLKPPVFTNLPKIMDLSDLSGIFSAFFIIFMIIINE